MGVFDSGVGGLTVVRELRRQLPDEAIVYLGDTARVPYGNKSAETVVRFSLEDARFLESRAVKAIVIACNTASAHALGALREACPVPVFGVIEPGVEAALRESIGGRIGIIGTMGTIASGAYQEALQRARPDALILAEPTPLLVPLVEEAWLNHAATRLILEEYLAPFLAAGIDTLVLACTHYPLLREAIGAVVGPGVRLVDSASACAGQLAAALAAGQLVPGQGPGRIELFLTDLPRGFSSLAGRFLGEETGQPGVVTLG
ncbi:MAG: glutamate racemase [Candidatus Methylacidiphilales bacterium]